MCPENNWLAKKPPTQPPYCCACHKKKKQKKSTKSLATFIYLFIYYWFCVSIGSHTNIFSKGIHIHMLHMYVSVCVNFLAVCLGWGEANDVGHYLWAFWHIRPLSGHFGRYVVVYGRKSLLATCVSYAVGCWLRATCACNCLEVAIDLEFTYLWCCTCAYGEYLLVCKCPLRKNIYAFFKPYIFVKSLENNDNWFI